MAFFWICGDHVLIFLSFSFSEPSITDMEWKSGSSKLGQTLSSSIVSLLVIVSSTAVSSLLLSSWTTQCAYNKPLMLVKKPQWDDNAENKNSPVWLNYLLALSCPVCKNALLQSVTIATMAEKCWNQKVYFEQTKNCVKVWWKNKQTFSV